MGGASAALSTLRCAVSLLENNFEPELDDANLVQRIRFEVKGKPRQNKSMRWNPRTNSPHTVSEVFRDRAKIVKAFQSAFPGWRAIRKPHQVKCEVECVFRCSKSNWIGGPCHKANLPDLDNVQKLLGDALNGLAYEDDSQIEELHMKKVWGPEPKTIITLSFYKPTRRPPNGLIKIDDSWIYYNNGEPIATLEKVKDGKNTCYHVRMQDGRKASATYLQQAKVQLKKLYGKFLHP